MGHLSSSQSLFHDFANIIGNFHRLGCQNFKDGNHYKGFIVGVDAVVGMAHSQPSDLYFPYFPFQNCLDFSEMMLHSWEVQPDTHSSGSDQ